MTRTATARSFTYKNGLTLIELVVAIAVVALLAVLLLPAVQQAREAARRTQCRSHLKQIGIALHGYHDVHGCIPPAVLSRVMWDGPGYDEGYSWCVYLLPHLDQSPLYDLIGPQGESEVMRTYYQQHGMIRPGGDTVLPVFRCPSAILPDHAADLGPAPMNLYGRGYATTDYKGCNGKKLNGLFLELSNAVNLGVNPMRFSRIRDGLSQTIAVGESSYPGTGGFNWPVWLGVMEDDESVFFRTTIPFNCGVDSFSGRYWMRAMDNGCAVSLHPGTAQFLFADGAVHALPMDIDLRVYEALGGRDDGMVVDTSF